MKRLFLHIGLNCKIKFLPRPEFWPRANRAVVTNDSTVIIEVVLIDGFLYICTRALDSLLSFSYCRAASTSILQLPWATFTLSIQSNFGVPLTLSPLISAIDILLAIWYSNILSSGPNHLNTLCPTLLASSLSI